MVKEEDTHMQQYSKSDSENAAVGIYRVDKLINSNGGWILQSIDTWNYYEAVIADEAFLQKLSDNPEMITLGEKIICLYKQVNLTDGNNFLLILRVFDYIFLADAYERYSAGIKDLLAAKKNLGSAITSAYQNGISREELTNIGISPTRIQMYCQGEIVKDDPTNNSEYYCAEVKKKIDLLHQAEKQLITEENTFRPLIEEYISYDISITSLAGMMKEKNPHINEEIKTIVTTIYNMLNKKQNSDEDKYFYAYCLHKYYEWKFTEISRIIGKNKSTGLRWVKKGEEIASEKKRTPKPSKNECIHHLTAATHEK